MKRIRTYAVVMIAVLVFGISGVMAQGSPALTDAEMRERLDYIRTSLNGGEGGATLWWWSWLGMYSAFTAGSFTIAALSDGDTERITYTVSGVQSALGVVGMLISPFAPRYAPARVRSLPGETPGELSQSLPEAQNLFNSAAEDAVMGRSWITHALALVVNGTGALVIWQKYGDRIEDDGGNPRREAIMNFVLGTIISEIQIFTQPTRAIRDREEYRRRYGITPVSNSGGDVRYFAAPTGNGMIFGAAWQWQTH